MREQRGSFVTGNAVRFTLRELQDVYRAPRNLAVLAIVSVVLGLAGPFGTYADFAIGPRLAYWTAIVFATFAIGLGATILLSALLRRWIANPVVCAGLAGVFAGAPVTAAVMAINLLAYGPRETLPPLPLLGYCAAISGGVALTLALFAPWRLGEAELGPLPVADADGPPPILDRVPPGRRGALLALSVSDHYVDVITERGTTLVLMRLGDAMRETGGIEGLQIHRSHWVARAAVVRSVREEGRVMLELSNGQRLPVSRGALPAVRAAGLLV